MDAYLISASNWERTQSQSGLESWSYAANRSGDRSVVVSQGGAAPGSRMSAPAGSITAQGCPSPEAVAPGYVPRSSTGSAQKLLAACYALHWSVDKQLPFHLPWHILVAKSKL